MSRILGRPNGVKGRRESATEDGEIKEALRSPAKSLRGLVFLRAVRSGRVPLPSKTSMFSMVFLALFVHSCHRTSGDERQQRGVSRPPRTSPNQEWRQPEDLHQPGVARRQEGRAHRVPCGGRQAGVRSWPLDLRARPHCVQPQPSVLIQPSRRGEGADRTSSGPRLPLSANVGTSLLSEARGRNPRR